MHVILEHYVRTLEDLKLLRSSLYCNFKKYEQYEKMLPTSNQPG